MTEQQVEELIEKYATGIATEAELQQLMDWYDSATITGVIWPAETTTEKMQLHERMRHRLQQELKPATVRRISFAWMRVAALLILVAGATILALQFFNPGAERYLSVTNPAGHIQLVRLPDSSRVWLNASSTLHYAKDFTQHRSITLEGEAYFEVTKDKTHPFTIQAGEVQTTVVGTSFIVQAYKADSNTRVSVLTGKVRVSDDARDLALLTPSMQLQFDRNSRQTITSLIDTTSIMAWTKGKLLFDGQSLAEVAATLERWYGIQIEFANPQLRNCRYYMSFDSQLTMDKLLSTMATITETTYSIDKTSNTVILSGTGCR